MTVAASRQFDQLKQLVERSGWHAGTRGLIEAAPHLRRDLTPEDCIETLFNLGLPLSFARGRLCDVTAGDCPVLFIGDDGVVDVVLAKDGDFLCLAAEDCATGKWCKAGAAPGTLARIESRHSGDAPASPPSVRNIARAFRGTVLALLFASLVTNLMALATPLLIMAIYDRVIPTRAPELVIALAIGMALVLLTDFVLRAIRSRAIAHMGATMEERLGLALFRKLAAVPISEIQKSDVDQQIARLKQFESMRDLFSGPVFTALLDAPFIAIFIGLLFVLSPPVGLFVVVAVICFVAAGRVAGPILSRLNGEASAARTAQQKLEFETIQTQRAVMRLGLGTIWHARHAELARATAEASRRARNVQMGCQAFGQSLLAIAGIGSIVLATMQVMAGGLGLGALIAIMSLVWKALAPVHALFVSLPQIDGFRRSGAQIDRVLALKEEFTRGAALGDFKAFEGRLTLSGVSHRYPGATEPSLAAVTLDIKAGECVAICGATGSGKTTLLDLVSALHQPLTGSLAIDDVNYRQVAVDELRQVLSVARQEPAFFHGTIRQNFTLACPDIADAEIREAVAAMGLGEELAHLPEGLDTRLTETARRRLSVATLRGLAIARCLVKPAAVYLLDDPAKGLDALRLRALGDWLARLRGRKTVLLAGNAAAHVRIADRCVCLDAGRVVVNDTGADGRRKALAVLNQMEGVRLD